MKRETSESEQSAGLIGAIRQRLEQEPLCLELHHYHGGQANSGDEVLHVIIIMQRELTQAEYQTWRETLHALAAEHGMRIEILFSSPRVWQDLKKLVGTFARIDRQAITDWTRAERV